MKNLKMYCVTNKVVNFLNDTNYNIGWVGKEKSPKNYINCNSGDNIFYKERHYSELTFHYWYWKNLLNIEENIWIGFCQKRRFWINKDYENKEIKKISFKNNYLKDAPDEWRNYESILCNPINVNNVKKIKLLKRGLKSIIKNPLIFFDTKKQSLLLHFDMHHGYGNLKKAISVMESEDRNEFLDYVNNSVIYNPHIMFIARPSIHKKWFDTLFPWLQRCEKIFGFNSLKGYDTERLYAYLAERYLSFWFKKHTKSMNWPWMLWEKDE